MWRRGFTNLLRTGESVGSLPENATSGQIASAVAEEGGRVGDDVSDFEQLLADVTGELLPSVTKTGVGA
jgi:hypothetical protein